jgi:hypothetical protein
VVEVRGEGWEGGYDFGGLRRVGHLWLWW